MMPLIRFEVCRSISLVQCSLIMRPSGRTEELKTNEFSHLNGAPPGESSNRLRAANRIEIEIKGSSKLLVDQIRCMTGSIRLSN